MKIMVVDDHPGFRQVMISLLQTTGAEILECEDGVRAIREYSNFQPDVVLMDIAMKGMDGLTATRQITTRFPSARVFILTQFDDPDLRQAAKQAGATGYLRKDDLSPLQRLFECPRPGSSGNPEPV
jgi:DNA-binding NarL/FixJ family response regulator